ncbi:hypothetical protein [Streptomyces sp. NPDC021622]|uniref:hypothetical protein n=1 Tax=Streptomyces sp. NPDC021622 TaxID=3155013 RepID=UPI003403DCB6
MDQDEVLRYASSFGAAAVAYAEHRPDYAQAAVCWALDPRPARACSTWAPEPAS